MSNRRIDRFIRNLISYIGEYINNHNDPIMENIYYTLANWYYHKG